MLASGRTHGGNLEEFMFWWLELRDIVVRQGWMEVEEHEALSECVEISVAATPNRNGMEKVSGI